MSIPSFAPAASPRRNPDRRWLPPRRRCRLHPPPCHRCAVRATGRAMSTLQEIEVAIEHLPAQQVEKLVAWLEQRRPRQAVTAPPAEPDFLARAKAIWGDWWTGRWCGARPPGWRKPMRQRWAAIRWTSCTVRWPRRCGHAVRFIRYAADHPRASGSAAGAGDLSFCSLPNSRLVTR